MFYFYRINLKRYRLSEDEVQTWPKAKTDYKSQFASLSNETTPPSSVLTQTFWNSNCKPLTISISLLITILPLFNLTKCLSSFTNIPFTSSLPVNDTEGHRRNMNRLNDVGLVKRIHSPILESFEVSADSSIGGERNRRRNWMPERWIPRNWQKGIEKLGIEKRLRIRIGNGVNYVLFVWVFGIGKHGTCELGSVVW